MVYDDELEEEVKPKTYGAELPKPTAKKSKQPVRITIPSLPDVSLSFFKSPQSGVTLCFQFVSATASAAAAAAAAAMTFASHVKTVWAKP